MSKQQLNEAIELYGKASSAEPFQAQFVPSYIRVSGRMCLQRGHITFVHGFFKLLKCYRSSTGSHISRPIQRCCPVSGGPNDVRV